MLGNDRSILLWIASFFDIPLMLQVREKENKHSEVRCLIQGNALDSGI